MDPFCRTIHSPNEAQEGCHKKAHHDTTQSRGPAACLLACWPVSLPFPHGPHEAWPGLACPQLARLSFPPFLHARLCFCSQARANLACAMQYPAQAWPRMGPRPASPAGWPSFPFSPHDVAQACFSSPSRATWPPGWPAFPHPSLLLTFLCSLPMH